MNGYSLTYSTDFTGSAMPSGWMKYSGAPGASDPGSQWATSHVVVSGGLLSLNAWQDPAFGNEWVTGGVGQTGVSRKYGAYFVRSRETGGGPTLVELLWPTNNVWPPEIDFDETQGLSSFTTATNIWAVNNGTKSQQESRLNIDMTQWNTFGVIWTPSSITYTVNGKAWGTFTNASEISATPMTLTLQQQTWCGAALGMDGEINACPTAPESTQVDWVVEYAAN
jgi:beta-glucanase (GH16 family)